MLVLDTGRTERTGAGVFDLLQMQQFLSTPVHGRFRVAVFGPAFMPGWLRRHAPFRSL